MIIDIEQELPGAQMRVRHETDWCPAWPGEPLDYSISRFITEHSYGEDEHGVERCPFGEADEFRFTVDVAAGDIGLVIPVTVTEGTFYATIQGKVWEPENGTVIFQLYPSEVFNNEQSL